ncbi:MAG: aspartate carbamoyltransferase [Spirochaetes bacterium GWB1_36_13]|nr:MAG: aspartate carbamoyltransferase [Spirochaetes bacterium GWB1_36_13]
MLEELFEVAKEMENLPRHEQPLKNQIMLSLFYEPSTRTRFSFESAMLKLGGSIITTENAKEFSSGAKGETLEDTIRVLNAYGDVIVLRHFQAGAAEVASSVSKIPVLNAGDGAGQHPTQALLDIYTIYKELGRIDDIKIAMVGDLANGRTVRSLSMLLAKNCKNVSFYFVSPANIKMKEDIKDFLSSHNVKFQEEDDLKKAAQEVDIIYQTRIQKERFLSSEDYEKAKGINIINKEIMNLIKPKTIIMHPLPRVDEISYEVDHDERAAYFRQAHNGLFIRMALLKIFLEK